ncbi:hypothetical protein BJ508DRAFT_313765 [Ascobolus immersus RN42]|uniref:F-box domain-containing protein n=1 Tax=Ascobolus immersus RN42 TaxID=1160509 RepID=A0A3N4HMY0_ASCIM|nr:hypothetical protein BJ508DRAFT_313765 [Ascobolus immersus RN42]
MTASILDLPFELWLQIFFLLPNSSAIALSSTVKYARAVYNSDIRIGMPDQVDWTKVLKLLDLRRPGAWPEWKEQKIVTIMRWKRKLSGSTRGMRNPPRYDFFDIGKQWQVESGTRNVQAETEDLDSDLEVDSESDSSHEENEHENEHRGSGWILEGLKKGFGFANQGILAKRTIEQHNHFLTRIAGNILQRMSTAHANGYPYYYYGSSPHRPPELPVLQAAPKTLSSNENARMLNILYSITLLQLDIFKFVCNGSFIATDGKERYRGVSLLIDYAPLLQLDYRTCHEYVFVLREMTGKNSSAWLGLGPHLRLHSLAAELSGIFHVRLYTLHSLGAYCPQIYNPEFGGVFWDSNEQLYTEIFKGIDAAIQKYKDDAQSARFTPLQQSADGQQIQEYLKAFNMYYSGRTITKEGLVAVRVNKDGVVQLDEKGWTDYNGDDGTWAIFKGKELSRLCSARSNKKTRPGRRW